MKTCKCGCGWPVFSHGYAKYCQYKRTDDKKTGSTAIKHSDRLKSLENSFGFDSQQGMFYALWDLAKDMNTDVWCVYTGERLNRFRDGKIWFQCFMHLLPKGKYTYFKLNPDNIRIVFPEFHRICDRGTSDDRKKHPTWRWDLWAVDVLNMKEAYAKFKHDNLLG